MVMALFVPVTRSWSDWSPSENEATVTPLQTAVFGFPWRTHDPVPVIPIPSARSTIVIDVTLTWTWTSLAIPLPAV